MSRANGVATIIVALTYLILAASVISIFEFIIRYWEVFAVLMLLVAGIAYIFLKMNESTPNKQNNEYTESHHIQLIKLETTGGEKMSEYLRGRIAATASGKPEFETAKLSNSHKETKSKIEAMEIELSGLKTKLADIKKQAKPK